MTLQEQKSTIGSINWKEVINMKRYVVEKVSRTVDGEKVVTIEVLDSKPEHFNYIVFI